MSQLLLSVGAVFQHAQVCNVLSGIDGPATAMDHVARQGKRDIPTHCLQLLAKAPPCPSTPKYGPVNDNAKTQAVCSINGKDLMQIDIAIQQSTPLER